MSRHQDIPRVAPPLRSPATQAAPPLRSPATKAAPSGPKLRVDWPNCKKHALCHELLPELVGLDEWGYPVVDDQPVPEHLLAHARRAVAFCPTLALRIVEPR